jgi:EpsI family protein
MPTDYLSRRYVAEDGTAVDMYLSFFDGQPESGRIHSPKHCMPGSGWFEMSSEHTTLELGGETVKLVRAVYAMGEQRELIYYWFDMRGKTMSDEYSLKLAEITGSIFHNRRDQSFIRISRRPRNVEAANERVMDFLRILPVIREFLPN